MKGLRLYLAPFAPDQSGAAAMLYHLGGIIVICDAGGCAGNVCGFDEPRWLSEKSAVFSAGLRDMDAILGRDDRLIAKLQTAAEQIEASFAAIIGTPVPAVIGTDYRALQRMAERRLAIPVLTVDTNGTRLYDEGVEKASLALFRTFAAETGGEVEKGSIGILGATPLDWSADDAVERLIPLLWAQGWERIYCYGLSGNLDDIRTAGYRQLNLVVSPAGLETALYLWKRFGTPYEIGDPLLADDFVAALAAYQHDFQPDGKRILIIHQQVRANELRKLIMQQVSTADVDVATWFMLRSEWSKAEDCVLQEEDDLCALVSAGAYDYIIGDSCFKRALPGFAGEFIALPHFAVSGHA